MEKVFRWTTPSEAIAEEVRHWQSVSPSERVAAVEALRQRTPGIYGDASQDWNEFIGLLNANRVRYLIVGAHALAANGRPRATQALDIFIDRSAANVTRLAGALRAFAFDDLADEADRFEQPERMTTLGKPPLRIDIMNHIDGVLFKRAWKGRLGASFGVHFLGLAELRANKLAAGRAKDRADVALMDEMEAGRAARRRSSDATLATSKAKKATKRRK